MGNHLEPRALTSLLQPATRVPVPLDSAASRPTMESLGLQFGTQTTLFSDASSAGLTNRHPATRGSERAMGSTPTGLLTVEQAGSPAPGTPTIKRLPQPVPERGHVDRELHLRYGAAWMWVVEGCLGPRW